MAVVKNSVDPQYSLSNFSKKLEPCKFSMAYYYLKGREFFYGEGGETLEHTAYRGGGCPIPGNI